MLPQALHVAIDSADGYLTGIDFLYCAVLSLYDKFALVVDTSGNTTVFSLGIQYADLSVLFQQKLGIGVSEPFQVMDL